VLGRAAKTTLCLTVLLGFGFPIRHLEEVELCIALLYQLFLIFRNFTGEKSSPHEMVFNAEDQKVSRKKEV
jgi:hypothetical protein